MFEVVLAVDTDTDRARNQAAAIAELPDAANSVTVTVLHVFSELQGDEGRQIDIEDYADVPEAVQVAVDTLEEHGVHATARTESGTPEAEILRVARELDADRIAVGGRKRSPVGKAVFGSVSQALILNADRPVLTVGNYEME